MHSHTGLLKIFSGITHKLKKDTLTLLEDLVDYERTVKPDENT